MDLSSSSNVCESVTVYNNITNEYVTYYGHVENVYCVISLLGGGHCAIPFCDSTNAITTAKHSLRFRMFFVIKYLIIFPPKKM